MVILSRVKTPSSSPLIFGSLMAKISHHKFATTHHHTRFLYIILQMRKDLLFLLLGLRLHFWAAHQYILLLMLKTNFLLFRSLFLLMSPFDKLHLWATNPERLLGEKPTSFLFLFVEHKWFRFIGWHVSAGGFSWNNVVTHFLCCYREWINL